MRLIVTILLFISLSANATNYYVANAGNDSNNGLTLATAWKTISKVNSSTFNAGDSILLNRGDSWNEKLTLTSSGSAENPIVVGAYGSGVKPLITGFQTVILTNVGNIWSGTFPNAVANLNTVLVNGKIQAKGRYPNASAANGGYLTFQSGTQTSITSSGLTGTPNYTGKECVVRTAVYILDVVKVASQSTSTLNFDRNLTYNSNGTGGNGFFFQNDSTFLDVEGEWSMDSVTKKLCVYSATSPVVQVSVIDTIVFLNHTSYITFDNLSVTGANIAAFQFDSLSNVTIQNCSINYSGTTALSAQKSSYLSAINNSIQNSLNGAIYWRRFDPYTPMQDTCNYATILGNYIKNTGFLAGMGLNSNGRYVGINVVGHKPVIINNSVDSTGFNGIFFNGDSSLIKNNYVSNFNFVKNDGAGIVTVIGGYIPTEYNNGSIIRGNIVVNGVGAPLGTNVDHPSACIYLDNYSKKITVDSNFLYKGKGAVFYLNEGDSNIITNNIMINDDAAVAINAGTHTTDGSGNVFKNNKFYSSSLTAYTFERIFGTATGNCDSNYYSRPSNEFNSLLFNSRSYRLADWQSATGSDLNSHITPVGILKGVAPLIVYNPTNSDSTITSLGYKRSLTGVDYAGSITLKPFTGAILFTWVPLYQSNAYKNYR